MTVFDMLLAPVMPILQPIEQQRRKHGNETFRWIDFVRILVFYFTNRCGSRNSLVISLENADPALELPHIAPMTLTDAFQRFSPALLRYVLKQLIATTEYATFPDLAAIGDLAGVDGSYFPIMGGLQLSKADDVSRMKLHLSFDLGRFIPIDFVVGAAGSNERQAFRSMLQKDVTYAVDRGYMAFALLYDCIHAQAHVVMRACSNIVVKTVEELHVDVPQYIHTHWTALRDRRVSSEHEDAHGIAFRLVEFTVGATTYKLITDRFDLSTFQVMLIYAYRWQVELIFRFFKHTMAGVEVITQSQQGMENYFAGMFLTALLHLHFKVDCLQKEGHIPPSIDTSTSNAETVDTAQSNRDATKRISNDRTRPTAQPAIASFLAAMNRKLSLFWKVSKHWLMTLSDVLHRLYTPDIVALLNKRAFANIRTT
jgi:hypothetical protein